MTNLNQTLGLCLSTNNSKCIKQFMLPSLSNMVELVDVTTWLINFQPPYTKDEIDEVVSTIKSYGFSIKYTYNEYDTSNNVPMCKIRNDTAKLMPEALIYGIVDDDMSFSGPSPKCSKTSGQQYLDAVRYMIDHKKCGVVIFGGQLFKKIPTHHIGISNLDNTYINSKGLFFKNLQDSDIWIAPTDSEWVVGADEEKIAAACRLAKGLYPAKMRACRTRHYENIKKRGTDGSSTYSWDKFDIVEDNATKYIRTHYNPDFKGNLSTIGGLNYYNVITPEQWVEAGGSVGWFTDPTLLEDYSEVSVIDQVSAIKEALL